MDSQAARVGVEMVSAAAAVTSAAVKVIDFEDVRMFIMNPLKVCVGHASRQYLVRGTCMTNVAKQRLDAKLKKYFFKRV
jgi:hypothetical protein